MKTRDEMLEMVKKAANPDIQAEALADLAAELGTVYDDFDASRNEVTKLTEQVNNLRDSNMRLFLRITGDAKEENEEPDIVSQVETAIFDKFKD